jgi:chemotaxis response regulator CheB
MPRVYLVFRNEIFRDAVRAILAPHPQIELIGETDEPVRVKADIETLAPDVVLLEEARDSLADSDVHTVISSPIPCRLITLRLDADGMHVWSQVWRRTVSAHDLVEAIATAGEIEP